MYNSSEFASATLSWNEPVGRVDSYNVMISFESNDSQWFDIAIPGLKVNQIPYNENITVSISAVNCVDESEKWPMRYLLLKIMWRIQRLKLICSTLAPDLEVY